MEKFLGILSVQNVLVVFLVSVFTWHIYALIKVSKYEKEILEKEAELDRIPHDLAGLTSGTLTQGQLDKMIARDQKPVQRNIELLEKKRRFLLEKAPLVGVFKK